MFNDNDNDIQNHIEIFVYYDKYLLTIKHSD